MWIAPDERASVARLLGLLLEGENLAADCARRQSELAPTPGMRKFLRVQSRHEQFHASVMRGGILCIAPRGAPEHDARVSLRRYRSLLERSLDRGRLTESLLAQQLILEGWGDAVLTRMSVGMVRRGLGLERVRRLLLGQEDAHQQFGRLTLGRLIAAGDVRESQLRVMSEPYLEIFHQMVDLLDDLFMFFGHEPRDYVDAVYAGIPPTWVQGAEPKCLAGGQ